MDTLQSSIAGNEVSFPTRISARGVIAGMLVGLALEVMLVVLGAAVGLSALEPRGNAATRQMGAGFAAWLLVAALVSAFVGAWVAAAAARALRRRDGVLHGVVTWAAMTLVGASIMGGALRGAAGPGGFGVTQSDAVFGGWALFVSIFLPLFTAIAGGVLAATRERRAAGIEPERSPRRQVIVSSPRSRSGDVPTQPLPST